MSKEKLDIFQRTTLFDCMMTHFKQDTFKYFNQAVALIEGNSEPETSDPETETKPEETTLFGKVQSL